MRHETGTCRTVSCNIFTLGSSQIMQCLTKSVTNTLMRRTLWSTGLQNITTVNRAELHTQCATAAPDQRMAGIRLCVQIAVKLIMLLMLLCNPQSKNKKLGELQRHAGFYRNMVSQECPMWTPSLKPMYFLHTPYEHQQICVYFTIVETVLQLSTRNLFVCQFQINTKANG